MARSGRKRAKTPPPYARIAETIAAIEAEMQRIGLWQNDPLPPEARAKPAAFLGDTMTFQQWLQFELVPRARRILAERGEFPERSYLGTMAVRNLDGMEEAGQLITLLGELDRLVER